MIALIDESSNRDWVNFIDHLVDAVVAGTLSTWDAKCEWMDQFKAAKYHAGDSAGTIDDFNSKLRRDLVIDVNVALRRGYRRWITDLDQDVMEAFPGMELTTQSAAAKRYWKARWADSGGVFRKNKIVALKVDPIWANISWFGLPWDPMDITLHDPALEDLDFDSCKKLGLFDGIATIHVPDPAPCPGHLYFLTALPPNLDRTIFAKWLAKTSHCER